MLRKLLGLEGAYSLEVALAAEDVAATLLAANPEATPSP